MRALLLFIHSWNRKHYKQDQKSCGKAKSSEDFSQFFFFRCVFFLFILFVNKFDRTGEESMEKKWKFEFIPSIFLHSSTWPPMSALSLPSHSIWLRSKRMLKTVWFGTSSFIFPTRICRTGKSCSEKQLSITFRITNKTKWRIFWRGYTIFVALFFIRISFIFGWDKVLSSGFLLFHYSSFIRSFIRHTYSHNIAHTLEHSSAFTVDLAEKQLF